MHATGYFFSFVLKAIQKVLKYLSVFEQRVLFIALIVHLIAAWLSIGFHHPDEHFQLVEFASYKLGKTTLNKLPWEFASEMRPGLQPLMVYMLLKPYYALGLSNPYHFTFLLRLLSGFAALCTAWQFHRIIAPQIRSVYLQKVHLILSLLGWGLVYLHVRFSSENWSAIAFTWAIIALWRGGKTHYLLFGMLAGLSFVFRFQAIFMIGGAGLWMLFIDKTSLKNISKVLAGFLLVFFIGILCDYWLYGHWTLSSWSYVYQNIFENKAATYGVSPWYDYFDMIFNQAIPPFSIIMLLSIPVMLLYKPRHILTWSMILFLLGHIVVAHKEFRFLFPLAFSFPFWAVSTLEYLSEKLKQYNQSKVYILTVSIFSKGFWIVNAIALVFMITKPASDTIALNKALYDSVKEETIMLYSSELDPYINGDDSGVTFYADTLLKSYRIDRFMNDTLALKGKNVLLFSEHAYPKDEFIFQHGGAFFDSSRTSIYYTRFPSWTYRFNINNWLERSNPFTIYQLHAAPVR